MHIDVLNSLKKVKTVYHTLPWDTIAHVRYVNNRCSVDLVLSTMYTQSFLIQASLNWMYV